MSVINDIDANKTELETTTLECLCVDETISIVLEILCMKSPVVVTNRPELIDFNKLIDIFIREKLNGNKLKEMTRKELFRLIGPSGVRRGPSVRVYKRIMGHYVEIKNDLELADKRIRRYCSPLVNGYLKQEFENKHGFIVYDELNQLIFKYFSPLLIYSKIVQHIDIKAMFIPSTLQT